MNIRENSPVRWNPFLLRWERWDNLVSKWIKSLILLGANNKVKLPLGELELFYEDTWCEPTTEDLQEAQLAESVRLQTEIQAKIKSANERILASINS